MIGSRMCLELCAEVAPVTCSMKVLLYIFFRFLCFIWFLFLSFFLPCLIVVLCRVGSLFTHIFDSLSVMVGSFLGLLTFLDAFLSCLIRVCIVSSHIAP